MRQTGFDIIIRAFRPIDPADPEKIAAVSKDMTDLRESLKAMGYEIAAFKPRLTTRRQP